MRTRSILRIGITVSATIYCASSVEVAVGRGRNRGEIRNGAALPEQSNRHSDGAKVNHSRSLGVGLDNLKYGNTKGQHHKDSKAKEKGKGGGNSDSGGSTVRGEGYPTSHGKGSGKGYVDADSMDSEDVRHPAPAKPSFSAPTIAPGDRKPTPQRKYKSSKKSDQSKLQKSDKGSRTYQPVSQPTRLPTTNGKSKMTESSELTTILERIW